MKSRFLYEPCNCSGVKLGFKNQKFCNILGVFKAGNNPPLYVKSRLPGLKTQRSFVILEDYWPPENGPLCRISAVTRSWFVHIFIFCYPVWQIKNQLVPRQNRHAAILPSAFHIVVVNTTNYKTDQKGKHSVKAITWLWKSAS